jgi:5'-3' exonuclease
MVICNDGKLPTWRNRIEPNYKKRDDKPALQKMRTAVNQIIPQITEMLEASGHPLLTVPHVEADDLIGILSARIQRAWKIPVVIVSNDGDYQSLLSPLVSILKPEKGNDRFTKITPTSFEQRYGFEPAVFPHYKAITGDSSDTLPGIHKIGPVGATTLVQSGVRFDSPQPDSFKERLTAQEWEVGRHTYSLVKIPRTVYDLPYAAEQQAVNAALTHLHGFNAWIECPIAHRQRLQAVQQVLSVYDVDARDILQYADVVNKWRAA